VNRVLFLMLSVLAVARFCPAALITLPQDCAVGGGVTCVTEEGNGGTGILFDNPTNTRVQAAFVAADFAAGGCPASCILSSISFRLDNFQASFRAGQRRNGGHLSL